MIRKAIQSNRTTLVVSLPKKWAERNNISKGSELNISETPEENLIISRGEISAEKSIDISLASAKPSIIRSYISALYRMGYTSINISFKDKNAIKELQLIIDSFYGFEIFDITEDSCRVKAVFEVKSDDIQAHFMKQIHIAKTMLDMLLEDLKNKKIESFEEIHKFRMDCLKQRDLINRSIILNRSIEGSIFPYYQLSLNLAGLTRAIDYLYKSMVKTRVIPADLTHLNKVVSLFGRLFYSLKTDFNYNVHEDEIDLTDEISKQLAKEKNSLLLAYCLRLLHFIQNSNAPMAMLRLAREH